MPPPELDDHETHDVQLDADDELEAALVEAVDDDEEVTVSQYPHLIKVAGVLAGNPALALVWGRVLTERTAP